MNTKNALNEISLRLLDEFEKEPEISQRALAAKLGIARGLPLKIVGVVAGEKIDNDFFGNHIFTSDDIEFLDYDAILVSSIDDKVTSGLSGHNFNNKKVFYL